MKAPRAKLVLRCLVAMILAPVAIILGPAGRASAAAPVIVNSNYLESLSVYAGESAMGGDSNEGRRVRMSFAVLHDPGDPVTAIAFEEAFNSSPCSVGSDYTTASNNANFNLTITEVPNQAYSGAAMGSGYSFVRVWWDAAALWGGFKGWVDGPGDNRVDGTTCARLKTQSGQTVTSGNASIHATDGEGVGGDQDQVYVSGIPQGQFDQNLTSGATLNFTYRMDDPDSAAGACDGSTGAFRWRTRNLIDGSVSGWTYINYASYLWGSGDGQDGVTNTVTVNFSGYARGRWIVEGYGMNYFDDSDINLSCEVADGYNATDTGNIFALGSVNVNYAAPAGLTLTPTPSSAIPANGGVLVGTAGVAASASGFTDSSGQVQIIDWDGGVTQTSRYERDINTSSPVTTAIASPQTYAFSNTDIPPGDYVVKAKATDNGAFIASQGTLATQTGGEATTTIRVVNPTSTVVTGCTPSPVTLGTSTTCTVTVTDTVTTGVGTRTKVDPTGNVAVTFDDTPLTPPGQSPTVVNCTLAGGANASDGISTCTASFNAPITDTWTVNAAYLNAASAGTGNGDVNHRGSSTTTPATVKFIGAATTATVSCGASVPNGGANSCTVTVYDNRATGAVAPAGTVTVYSGAAVTPAQATCSLAAASANTSTCSVSVTPNTIGQKATFAYYGGNGAQNLTSATSPTVFWNSLRHSTTTALSCPSGMAGSGVTCTVTVTDTQSPTIAPTGTVTVYSSPDPTPATATCTLATVNASQSSCTVTVTPPTQGQKAGFAYYPGDNGHFGSSSPTIFYTVTGAGPHPTTVSVSCPNGGSSVSCTVSVTDTLGGSPKGTVYLYTSPDGAPNATTCSLTTGSPTATCSISSSVSATGLKAVFAYYEGYNAPSEKYQNSQSSTVFWTSS